jgi:hypothetical protein
MPDPAGPPFPHPPHHLLAGQARKGAAGRADDDRMLCDRCRAEMFRMHAVWRCPVCGFKTDCCGW